MPWQSLTLAILAFLAVWYLCPKTFFGPSPKAVISGTDLGLPQGEEFRALDFSPDDSLLAAWVGSPLFGERPRVVINSRNLAVIDQPAVIFALSDHTSTADGQITALFANATYGITIEDRRKREWRRMNYSMSLYHYGPTVLAPNGHTIAISAREIPPNEAVLILKLIGVVSKILRTKTPYTSPCIALYDTTSGELLSSLPGINCVAFAHDGKTLAAANEMGQIELWDYPLKQPARLMHALLAVTLAAATFSCATWWRWRRNRKPSQMAPSGLT
jgi:WD40 repeat protein